MQVTCWHCDGKGHTYDAHNIEIEIEADELGASNAQPKLHNVAEEALQQYAKENDLEDGDWDRPPEIEEIEDCEPAPAIMLRNLGVPDLFSLVGVSE